MIKQYYRNL